MQAVWLDKCLKLCIVTAWESALHMRPMTDENAVDREIKKIEDWLAKSGVPESRLGLMACANQRAVERVRNGKASVQTLRALVDYISKNPAGKRS